MRGKERERKRKNERKKENKTTGKVERKGEGESLQSAFFAPTGQKVTA